MDVFFEAGMETGEGPIWDPRNGTLYCVDSTNPALWAFVPGSNEVRRYALPQQVGFAALTYKVDTVVLGLEDGLYAYDLNRRELRLIIDPEPGIAGNRINDGTVDIDGGLIFGTLDLGLRNPTGSAYKLFPDGRLLKFDEGYIVFNGPFADPANPRIFAVNSEVHEVYVFDREADGSFTNKRLFTEWPREWGIPDGLVMDSAGNVWIAHWDGSRITRFSPSGRYEAHIELPVGRVTKIAFGGEDLRTIYATTANRGVERRLQPLAGSVFRLEQDYRGLGPRFVADTLLAL